MTRNGFRMVPRSWESTQMNPTVISMSWGPVPRGVISARCSDNTGRTLDQHDQAQHCSFMLSLRLSMSQREPELDLAWANAEPEHGDLGYISWGCLGRHHSNSQVRLTPPDLDALFFYDLLFVFDYLEHFSYSRSCFTSIIWYDFGHHVGWFGNHFGIFRPPRMTPQGLQADFACKPSNTWWIAVFLRGQKGVRLQTPCFRGRLSFSVKIPSRKDNLDNFLMIGNILRTIGIVEICEKNYSETPPGP